jgi:hypothetical protein
VPVTVELVSVAVGVAQLSVYKAAIAVVVGAAVAADLHRLPEAPPGSTPLSVGACVSPPV